MTVTKQIFCLIKGIGELLIAFVTDGEPTPCNYHMNDVSTFNGASRGNKWQTRGETRYSPQLVSVSIVF